MCFANFKQNKLQLNLTRMTSILYKHFNKEMTEENKKIIAMLSLIYSTIHFRFNLIPLKEEKSSKM